MKKSVVLLSAGLDSTVNFFEAREASEVVLALTFDYGQRAAAQEIRSAKKIASSQGVVHQVVELPFFKSWGGSSLTDSAKKIPVGSDVSIDDQVVSTETARSVWVPNRNGVFLNIAAGFAESLGADWIVPGFNKEEAATFPDNSQEFLDQMTRSLFYSTGNHVTAKCFTTNLDKTKIVKRAIDLKVDLRQIWPCYFNGASWCGECESCQRSRRALQAQGLSWKNLSGSET